MVSIQQLTTILSMSPQEVRSTLGQQPVPGVATTEEQAIVNFLNRKSKIVTPNGQVLTIDLFQKYQDLILKAIANFKTTRALKKTVTPASITTVDTIGVETLDRPGVFGLTSYQRTGLTPGVINVIKTDGTDFTLDAQQRERVVLLGFINMIPGSGISEIQVIDDGNTIVKPENSGYQFTYDVSARIYELEVPRIADTKINVKARLTEGNSLFLVPVGIHIYDGTLAPSQL